jgi:hypothetical protein
MNRRLLAGVTAGVAVLAGGGLAAWHYLAPAPAPQAQTADDSNPSTLDQDDSGGPETITTVQAPGAAVDERGATPMAQRVAVLGILNKRDGLSRDVTIKPGQAIRSGGVIVRLRACDHTAPWEPEQLTGAFVQLDVEQLDHRWHRVFSGWLYKERPSLNVVLHPIYDVWPKSCTMSFPETGPETVVTSAGGDEAPAANRSSAKKSAVDTAPAPAPAPTAPSNAADSNPT